MKQIRFHILERIGHVGNYSNPCHDERGRFCSTGGGVPAAAKAVMEKYKNEQAWNEPIREYMESRGLTLDDYKKANDALYAHNVSSGPESDRRLSRLWNSDSSEGRALRAMSQWNEWHVQNGPGADYRKENAPTWTYAKQVIGEGGNWRIFKGAEASGSLERFKEYMIATSRGEAIFYRKGGLDRAAISTTTNESGARSGSSLFKPDHWFSFRELKAAGYYLLSGARGMVGVTSAQEGEHIWLKPLKRDNR